MAEGDVKFDGDGNVLFNDDGTIRFDDGSGDCCCGCEPFCADGAGAECGNCDECAPTKATAQFDLSSFNGCYLVRFGWYLKLNFNSGMANFCLTGSGCTLQWSVSLTVTDAGFGGGTSCLGTHTLHTDNTCTTRQSGTVTVSLTLRAEKIDRENWQFTAKIIDTASGDTHTPVDETWFVADGTCDPTHLGTDVSITACSCPETPITTTGTACYLVTWSGGSSAGCKSDSGAWAKMTDCGGGTFASSCVSLSLTGLSSCSPAGSTPMATGYVYTDSGCTSINGGCCDRVNTQVNITVQTLSCFTPTLYRWTGSVQQQGSGCSPLNPGAIVCGGVAYTTSLDQRVLLSDTGSTCLGLVKYCSGGTIQIERI